MTVSNTWWLWATHDDCEQHMMNVSNIWWLWATYDECEQHMMTVSNIWCMTVKSVTCKCWTICWRWPKTTALEARSYIPHREQWQFQSGQVTRAGDTHEERGRLMGKSDPPPNRWVLDWSVVFNVGRLCPIVPQDNIVVSNKYSWPEFYPGNAWACLGLEPPMIGSNKRLGHYCICFHGNIVFLLLPFPITLGTRLSFGDTPSKMVS